MCVSSVMVWWCVSEVFLAEWHLAWGRHVNYTLPPHPQPHMQIVSPRSTDTNLSTPPPPHTWGWRRWMTPVMMT